MADYYNNNQNSGRNSQRRLEDIFADVDASYDYDNDGSAGSSSGMEPEETTNYRTGTSSAASSRTTSSAGSAQRRTAASRTSSQRTRTASRSRSSARASRPAEEERTQRRSSRTSASRSQASLNRKRKKKFRKYLLIYVAVLVVILIIGCIMFSSYLASYENDQPAHVAEAIVDTYQTQEGIVAFLTENAAKTGAQDNIGEIAQTYATNIAGKQVSFRENNDFRPDNPAYDITADGSIVAKVTLMAATGSDSFAKSKWAIQSLNVTDFLPNALTITVEAPVGATVTVGDKVLDDSYVESTGVPAILQNSVQFLADPPEFNTYRVGGLLSEPEVKVSDSAGTEYSITKIDNSYTASPKADQAFIDSVKDRVYDAIDNYATYFIHMSFELANYIVYGSELYSYIFGSDTMDPIATALYMFEDIESYDFAERSADNYIKYCDDCFTVDIKYALDMKFTDPTYEDNNQNMDATWVFVIEPLDGSWCISDIITH